MTRQVFDQNGRPVVIGKELGCGGEGAVFEISGSRDYVAKIYHKSAVPEKAHKLALMIRLGGDSLKEFAAWPTASLHETVGGPTKGLVMPKIAKPIEIHELYSPAHRKVEFPTSDWRFLVRTALNCAAAFQSLHSKQIVIGDVNQGNILVSRNATVSLIDCDSFQISGNGVTYKCRVGVAHFTPPELSSYEMVRTINHDNFGLAVMVFHLLFMGRHPFSGRFSGQGDMPLEKAIKENRFAYGRNASRFQMSPPPSCLSLQELPTDISNMFEAAFADPRMVQQRPTATQWGKALLSLESGMRKCARDPGHFHYQGRQCPWCRIIQQGGPNFFVSVSFKTAEARSANFRLHKIWFELRSVKGPGESFNRAQRRPASTLTPRPIPPSIDKTKVPRLLLACIAGGGVFLTFISFFLPILAVFSIPVTLIFSIWWVILWTMRPVTKEVRRRKRELAQRKSDLERAKQNMSFVAQRHLQSFESKRQQLDEAKSRYEGLKSSRDAEYNQLQSNARERQLEDYLERCFISKSKIRGVGPSRLVALESYGIETAADITYDRVNAVPGFGPTLTEEMVVWRRIKEAMFKFDPSRGAPASAVQALDMKYLQQRSQIESLLGAGANELRRLTNAANSEVGRLDEHLAQLELYVSQAKLDASVTAS